MKNTVLLLILAATHVFAQTNTETLVTSIDGYAARVNNRIITYGDIRESVLPIMMQMTQQYQGADLPQRIQQIYLDGRETLIEEALFIEEAKRLGLTLPENVIDDEINDIIRQRFENDRARFTRALAERRITYQEWRQDMTDQLVMRVYYSEEVLRRVHITEEDIGTEYENIKEEHTIPFRVKYRFILINKGNTPEEQQVKRAQAESTLQKLRAGADFITLAQEVSEGDTTLSPWRDPADVRAEIRPALHATGTGQISELIETPTVFYIIKVESRQEQGYIPYADLREQIKQELTNRERERLHKKLVDRLTARHYIERY